MAIPVVVITKAGTYEAERDAIEWLWEMLDADELPETHAALGRSLNGENLTLPDAELQRFGQALDAILGRLSSSSPHEQALADLRAHVQ